MTSRFDEFGQRPSGEHYREFGLRGESEHAVRDRIAGSDYRVPGPETGRGPRGYHRSDARIQEEINDRLTAHGWIDATDIDCKVEDGEVLLIGFVDSPAVRQAAEDVADEVTGVKDVHNHLRVRSQDNPDPGPSRARS